MKKTIAIILVLVMCLSIIAACSGGDDDDVFGTPPPTDGPVSPPPEDGGKTEMSRFEELGLEIGADGNVRFIEPREIRVLTCERSDNEDPNTAFTA